jgi:hypothetical protein
MPNVGPTHALPQDYSDTGLWERHTLCDGLRHGRAGKTGAEVPHRTQVRCASYVAPVFPPNHLPNVCRVARDPRFERLPCSHQGTYADDCLVHRVTANKCYIVATCDRELRRRIRKVPGVPLMYIVSRRYAIERLPDQGAPT